MNEIKLLSIFAENKLGFLAKITQTLATANINILWFKIIDNSGDNFGLLRVLVNHRSKAIENLKANGFTVSSVPILAVYIEDIPGALAGIADILSKENINIRNGLTANTRSCISSTRNRFFNTTPGSSPRPLWGGCQESIPNNSGAMHTGNPNPGRPK